MLGLGRRFTGRRGSLGERPFAPRKTKAGGASARCGVGGLFFRPDDSGESAHRTRNWAGAGTLLLGGSGLRSSGRQRKGDALLAPGGGAGRVRRPAPTERCNIGPAGTALFPRARPKEPVAEPGSRDRPSLPGANR